MPYYRIEMRRGRRPIPVVVTEDPDYALAGEFLLAEGRNFGAEILEAMGQVRDTQEIGEFSGNVFRLEIGKKTTKILDDLSDRSCTLATDELRNMAMEYVEACGKLPADH